MKKRCDLLSVSDYFFIVAIAIGIAVMIMSVTDVNSRLDNGESLSKLDIFGEYAVDGGNSGMLTSDNFIPEANGADVVFTGHFSTAVPVGERVWLRVSNCYLTVNVNGKVVCKYDKTSVSDKYMNSTGDFWTSFVSEGIAYEDNVEITLSNCYGTSIRNAFNKFVNNIYSGSRFSLEMRMYSENRYTMIAAAFLGLIGIIIFVVSVVFSKYKLVIRRGFFYFSGFLICSSIWFLINPDYFVLLCPYPALISILRMTVLVSCTILFCKYVSSVVERMPRRILGCIDIVMVISLAAGLLIQALSDVDMTALTPLYLTLCGIMFVASIAFLVYEKVKFKKNEASVMIASCCFLIAGAVLESANYYFGLFPMFMSFALSVCLFAVVQTVNIVSQAKVSIENIQNAKTLESKLLQSRISVMLTQIQPHFIFNTLNSISGLCMIDPEKADDAIIQFSDYLRSNINALKSEAPVPFSTELEHVKQYVALEELRFGDKINVEYDIRYWDFSLPTLTIEPIVENAIKHGINPKAEGGTVSIKTKKSGNCVVITISDDGEGFDSQSGTEASDSKNSSHSGIGLENIISRLQYYCDAEVSVKSKIGEGTTVVIKLILGGDAAESEGKRV